MRKNNEANGLVEMNKKEHSYNPDKDNERELNDLVRRYIYVYKMKNGYAPSEKLIRKEKERLVKNYFSDDKGGLHQAEKEDGQMNCLLELLRNEGMHLSLEEMSRSLVNSGFVVGSSVKTLYRRILPKLLNQGALKDDEGKYYIPEHRHDPEFEKRMEERMSETMEVVSILSNFLETIKDSPVYEKAKDYIDGEIYTCKRRLANNAGRQPDENIVPSRVIFMGAPAANIEEDVWNVLYEAMQRNRYVHISYKGEGKSRAEKYTVQPYQLIFDNGFWELWGQCTTLDHKGRKLFNLSRINSVDILEKEDAFILPENYDFRSTLAGNFGCYNDDVVENYSIKLKKDSYAYLYIKDRVWGEFQEIKDVEDGYVLEFEATQYLPILRWVLSWGAEVEPLEPERLVEDWKGKIREMGKIL